MKRIPALVAASALLLAACGRATQMASEDATPTATESTVTEFSTPAPSGGEELSFLPWDGDVPIWSLGFEETAQLLSHGVPPGLPSGCYGQGGDPSLPFEECVGKLLTERGVSDAAQELYVRHGLTVSTVDGTGPIKVLHLVADWTKPMSIFGPGGYAIQTSRGILTGERWQAWSAWQPAFAATEASDVIQGIESRFTYLALGDSLYVAEEYPNYIARPERADGGWSVPVYLRLGGYGVEATDFFVRFDLSFSGDGDAMAVSFAAVCWDSAFGKMPGSWSPSTLTSQVTQEFGIEACPFPQE